MLRFTVLFSNVWKILKFMPSTEQPGDYLYPTFHVSPIYYKQIKLFILLNLVVWG